ncbi:MAG: ATP-binding protein [Thermodesulfobacteriota bacterium]|nr:ATP-binding protein [Thermodesulfobacteriota bacterium]
MPVFYKKKMNIHTHLCKNSETIVSPESIKQVFQEVINNAAEAIETSGIISVSSTNENKCMTICINDTGRGILPEHLSQVFEPYQSFNPKKSRGIGLFIAKKIIEDHNGTIKIESTYSQGTSVIITLPEHS